jgi:hypothetical protein
MHPAEIAGDRAGRSAAIEDRAQGSDQGAKVLVLASMSAAAWLADNPCFADHTGESRQAYIERYLAAYHRELKEPV